MKPFQIMICSIIVLTARGSWFFSNRWQVFSTRESLSPQPSRYLHCLPPIPPQLPGSLGAHSMAKRKSACTLDRSRHRYLSNTCHHISHTYVRKLLTVIRFFDLNALWFKLKVFCTECMQVQNHAFPFEDINQPALFVSWHVALCGQGVI